jgi:hypothetical protein
MRVPKILIVLSVLIIFDCVLKQNVIGALGYATVIILCLERLNHHFKKTL